MFLPQYNPYQRSDGDVAAALTMAAILWGLLILLGTFLLCAWATKIVLQHIVNPYLKGALDRDDGLVVVWSTLIWSVIGLVFTIPSVAVEPTLAFPLLGAGAAGGAAWGASIGAFLVVMLWLEVDEPWEPTHGFEAITGLPGEHYRPAELDTQSKPEVTLSEIEAMLRGDTDPSDADFEDPIPVAVPTPSTNNRPIEAVGV